MSGKSSKREDVLLSILATGIYRPWFWANYKTPEKQAMLRSEWQDVTARFSSAEIRVGMRQWEIVNGEGVPPEPNAFVDLIRPRTSSASKEFFDNAKKVLGAV